MMLLLFSEPDTASMNVRGHLLRLREWKETGTYLDGRSVLASGRSIMAVISGTHLYRDHIDGELEALGYDVEGVIVASRHASSSGRRCLTVHPLGNFDKAGFGGVERTLVPAFPHGMTRALRILARLSAGMDTVATFEATHHGPMLGTPTFFMEIGSGEREWSDPGYGLVLARCLATIADPLPERDLPPVAIGIGGGHYAPRVTDVALTRRISFGHIVPGHVASREGWPAAVRLALASTPGVSCAYIDRKSLRKSRVRELCAVLEREGVRVVRSSDLLPVEASRT